MEKLTFGQLVEKMYQHNETPNAEPIQAVIVFKSSSWPGKDYSLESRSYAVSSENKYFKDCIGNSLYGSALDGSDPGVRLDWYMNDSKPWAVDYCYIK